MDTPTLKSVRLVCPVWADVGARFLGKQGRLTFSTPHNRIINKELTPFNHDLAKNIKLLFYTTRACYCNAVCTCSPYLPPNFVTILPEISNKLETLKFFCVRAFEPAHEIWSAYHFPNLTHISITANGEDIDNKGRPRLEMTEFQLLPNLKVFSVTITPSCEKVSSKIWMSTFCQKLLNSAPNLEEVDLNTSFYRKFTECRKLRNLSLKLDSWGNFQFEISQMTKMLDSCRNSVESLTLDYLGWYNGPIEVKSLHFYSRFMQD